jgi:hypothetical protein
MVERRPPRRWLPRKDPKKPVVRTPKRWVSRRAHVGGWPYGKMIDMARSPERPRAKPPPKRKGPGRQGDERAAAVQAISVVYPNGTIRGVPRREYFPAVRAKLHPRWKHISDSTILRARAQVLAQYGSE